MITNLVKKKILNQVLKIQQIIMILKFKKYKNANFIMSLEANNNLKTKKYKDKF